MKNAIDAMVNEIIRIMDGDMYGIWLYGSVVMDDFRRGWSDIDFVALTRGEISETQAEQLLMLRQQMLEKDPGNPYYRSFEGVIANLDEYREGKFRRLVDPYAVLPGRCLLYRVRHLRNADPG